MVKMKSGIAIRVCSLSGMNAAFGPTMQGWLQDTEGPDGL